jgi:hypothetical protein
MVGSEQSHGDICLIRALGSVSVAGGWGLAGGHGPLTRKLYLQRLCQG